MNVPFYISKRYLVSKKSQNAINIISGISVLGVAVGTMALIVILSVFNGFDDLIKSLYSTFDPEIKITLSEGKTFSPVSPAFSEVRNHKNVWFFSEVLEENVLLRYGERQYISTMKGVDDEFVNITGLDTMIVEGEFMLKDNGGHWKMLFTIVGKKLVITQCHSKQCLVWILDLTTLLRSSKLDCPTKEST